MLNPGGRSTIPGGGRRKSQKRPWQITPLHTPCVQITPLHTPCLHLQSPHRDYGTWLQEQLGAVAVSEGLLRSHSKHLLPACVEDTGVRVCPAVLSSSIFPLQLQRAKSCHGGALLLRVQKHHWLGTREEKQNTGGDLNHLLRRTAVTACPGRPGRSVVCAHVAQLGLCYCLQHEWGVTFLLMGKREQRSDLSPKHRAAPKLASSKFSISQQTRQCFSGGKRYSEFITVHRAPAASVILTSSVRGVSGSYSFLQ